jgi:hypothetical protein
MVFAAEETDRSSRAKKIFFPPFCDKIKPVSSDSFETDNYLISWAKEGVVQGVRSADFISIIDLGDRLLLLLGDVQGKGCLVLREDMQEGLTSDQIAAASVSANCATKYQELFSEVCKKNSEIICSSETPAVTAIELFFKAAEKRNKKNKHKNKKKKPNNKNNKNKHEGKKGISKNLDFALIVLDNPYSKNSSPQRSAHICAASVLVFLESNSKLQRIEPNATIYYPGVGGVANSANIPNNQKERVIPLKPDDRIVVASDGLDGCRQTETWKIDVASRASIEKALEENSPQTGAEQLLRAAREHAGFKPEIIDSPTICPDDTTLVVISVNKPPPLPSL